jgi:3-oxoacyl-[acyl-carrier protein] reductase
MLILPANAPLSPVAAAGSGGRSRWLLPRREPACARGAEALAATREEIARHGGVADASVCDLSDAAAIPPYIEAAAAALGGIDILVNNASGFGTSDDEAGWAVWAVFDTRPPSPSTTLLPVARAPEAAEH